MTSFSFRKASMTAVALTLVIMSMSVATAAHAYGSTHLWQVTISQNCDNPSYCLTPPFGMGGFWGWIEFDSGLTGDATLTGCTHASTSIGALTGANHFQVDISGWSIGFGSAGPQTFFIDSAMVTISGTGVGHPVTLPLGAVFGAPFDTGVPAMAGHYNTFDFLGFKAPPGISFQITVVQMH